MSEASAVNADHQVMVADFNGWEATHGASAPDTIVLIRTDFAKRWHDARSYLGTNEKGAGAVAKLLFPGAARRRGAMARAEAREGRGPRLGEHRLRQSTLFEAHRILHERNIRAFENLAALATLPARGATVYALPMKIKGGSGGPLRALAAVPADLRAAP